MSQDDINEPHRDDIPVGPLPKTLAGLMQKWVGRTLGKDAPKANDLFSRWRTIVGDQIADNVTPMRLENGVLTVEVTENAWATQLRFLERQLIATLGEHVGNVVTSIQVRVRGSR